tara:strand:- start:906 stop:1502 length:597 start_codon:yes stop_codon:yes gene_type:complete
MSIHPKAEIHPTAIIDNRVKIGANTKIWHWVHISSDVKIGDQCSLGQNVFIGNKVIIGMNVKIQNNVSVFENVIIEDDVFCGPSMVFTNVYNPRSRISRKEEYKTTRICKGATLGANCTIICGIEIGKDAFIGAGAVVNKDVKPFALVVGVPARQIGWFSTFGEKIDLPLNGNGKWKCKNTGDIYILKGEDLFKKENP